MADGRKRAAAAAAARRHLPLHAAGTVLCTAHLPLSTMLEASMPHWATCWGAAPTLRQCRLYDTIWLPGRPCRVLHMPIGHHIKI